MASPPDDEIGQWARTTGRVPATVIHRPHSKLTSYVFGACFHQLGGWSHVHARVPCFSSLLPGYCGMLNEMRHVDFI